MSLWPSRHGECHVPNGRSWHVCLVVFASPRDRSRRASLFAFCNSGQALTQIDAQVAHRRGHAPRWQRTRLDVNCVDSRAMFARLKHKPPAKEAGSDQIADSKKQATLKPACPALGFGRRPACEEGQI